MNDKTPLQVGIDFLSHVKQITVKKPKTTGNLEVVDEHGFRKNEWVNIWYCGKKHWPKEIIRWPNTFYHLDIRKMVGAIKQGKIIHSVAIREDLNVVLFVSGQNILKYLYKKENRVVANVFGVHVIRMPIVKGIHEVYDLTLIGKPSGNDFFGSDDSNPRIF